VSEHDEQVALIEWAQSQINIYPELQLLYAVPNQGGAGRAAIIRGQKMKREGMRKGVPDLCLPISRGNFLTLYIEMKDVGSKGRLSPEQTLWVSLLSEAGHNVQVCHGFEEAMNTLINYLRLDDVLGDAGGNAGPEFTYD
jgi:hypothetical protein|tara:strand:+ start:855 stop:1274 length:420 start_codon:yes stop_codon:yes gene_type:complete